MPREGAHLPVETRVSGFFLRRSQLELILRSDFHLAECSRTAVLQCIWQGSGGYGFILSAGPRKEKKTHAESGSNTFPEDMESECSTWFPPVFLSINQCQEGHKSILYFFCCCCPTFIFRTLYDVTKDTDELPRLVITPPARCWLHLWTRARETHTLHRMNPGTICIKRTEAIFFFQPHRRIRTFFATILNGILFILQST